MGFHAGVLQVQRCERDLNVPQFALLSFSQSRPCNQHHKNNLRANKSDGKQPKTFGFNIFILQKLPCKYLSLTEFETSRSEAEGSTATKYAVPKSQKLNLLGC